MHGVRSVNIGGVMHCDILCQRHRVSNNGSVMHGVRSINIGCVMHCDIFRQCHRVGYDGGVVHGVGYFDIGGVVHGVRSINICGVVDIYVGCVMHVHRVDWGSGWCGCCDRCLGRLLFAIGELSAERQPYGVAGMQGMNVHMGDGVVALHLIGFGNRVDRLSFLDDVHIVFAPMQHLLLMTHLDRCGTGLLRPGRGANQ